MKIKHPEIEILKDHPFTNCKLGRHKYAMVLSDIIKVYSDGFVLAINNEWGAGKTTFVKMWQQHLQNEGFETIYFNAWENDFDCNPLIAIISELNSLPKAKGNKTFNSILKKGAVYIDNIVPTLIKSLSKKYIVDIDEVAIDAIENSTKSSTTILKDSINSYTSKKKTINEFRIDLEKFIKQTNDSKPLIFIIDELDRCRPTYAVEVLEQIKHLFSVSGIIFVLSIDKNHLSSSIKGFYGSEQIDSNEYLRRFIDLEYSIPKPTTKDFTNYLFGYYLFEDFFYSKERKDYKDLRNDSENFLLMAEYIFSKESSTLRQQERVFGVVRLILSFFKSNEYAFPHIIFLLVYLKDFKNEFYLQIEKGTISLNRLCEQTSDWVFNEASSIDLGYIQAHLLWFYNNNKEYPQRINLLETDENGKPKTTIKSKLISDDDSLAFYFQQIDRKDYRLFKLDFLLKKINLSESVLIK